MFWQSIKRKIVSIALGLIILMVITSVLSIIMANKVDYLLNELTTKYIAAYGHLARTNIRSLENALAVRRMVIAKMQNPPDEPTVMFSGVSILLLPIGDPAYMQNPLRRIWRAMSCTLRDIKPSKRSPPAK